MRVHSWIGVACVGALCCVACGAKQQRVEEPMAPTAAEAAAEPFSPSGDMEVGVSFDEGEEPPEEEEEGYEPPPTPTYSPANKLSPEEKAAAEKK